MMQHRWLAKALTLKAISKLGLLPLYHRAQQRGGRLKDFHPRSRAEYAAKLYTDVGPFVPVAGATLVEIGTGWVPVVPLALHIMGAGPVITYDLTRHLQANLTMQCVPLLRDCVEELVQRAGVNGPECHARLERLLTARTVDELFKLAQITYHAPGDASVTGLPDGSVDILFSNLVLQQIPAPVVEAIQREAWRILTDDGVCWHNIDYRDQYAAVDPGLSEINFLRYGQRAWDLLGQNDIVWQSRRRDSQYRDQFRRLGFSVATSVEYRSEAVRSSLPHFPLAPEYADCSAEDLVITTARMVLRKTQGTSVS